MKEGIHPNYYQATVTCNCGNTFVTGSTKKERTSTSRFAPSAIRSIPASRRAQEPTDVLTSSIRSTALTHDQKHLNMGGIRLRLNKTQPIF